MILQQFRTEPSTGKVMVTLFWDEKGVILEHYTPRGTTVTSASCSDLLQNHLRPAIKSKRRGLLSSGVLLQHDNARPHIASTTVATTCILSVFLIHHTHQTLPQAISICLDHSKEQWEERSSVLMKRYATRCMSVCADYQKNFFLKEFMYFVSAGGIALSVGEIMLKSDTALYHFCTINGI